MSIKPISKKQNIVVQELEKELLVYDLKTNKAFCLNETSALVYQLCDGTKTVAEISQALNKNLKQSIGEDLIWLALDSFKKENLLEESKSFAVDYNGLSRRQVIKKVGLASMIALPVILSVAAPAAAAAASGSICYASDIGICMKPSQICPASCPSNAPVTVRVHMSTDGTCSGVLVEGPAFCPFTVPGDFILI